MLRMNAEYRAGVERIDDPNVMDAVGGQVRSSLQGH